MSTQGYRHSVGYVSGQVWAIKKATLHTIVDVLNMRAQGIALSNEEIQARVGAAARGSGAKSSGSVAVLPLYGLIDHKVSMMSEISGGTAITSFMAAFRQVRDDQSVSAIILDVDSPGGSIYGIEEAADEIFASRSAKPITAMVNPECGSAALWVATAAKEIVCTPSGFIGSLGCYTVHLDRSEANAKIGIKPTYIAYGDHKVDGNPDAPLDEETLAHLQKQVNAVGEKFVRAVARGRGVSMKRVRDEYGQGRMFSAEEALAVGMIDRIATLEQTIERIAGKRTRSSARALAAEDQQCGARMDGLADAEGPMPMTLLCTLGKGHDGLHAAHVSDGEIVREWGDAVDTGVSAANEFEAAMANVQADVAQSEADRDYIDAGIRIAERL